jgi:hypothetical protein
MFLLIFYKIIILLVVTNPTTVYSYAWFAIYPCWYVTINLCKPIWGMEPVFPKEIGSRSVSGGQYVKGSLSNCTVKNLKKTLLEMHFK